MGNNILGSHAKAKLGTALADRTADQARETFDEALEIFGDVGATLGGDNAQDSLTAANQLKAIALSLREAVIHNAGGKATLNLNTNGASTNNGAVAAVASSKPQEMVPATPSIEEELGAELLKQAGDPLRARQWLTNLVGIFSTDPNLPDYIAQVVAALKHGTHPDKLMVNGGNVELKSTIALRKKADALEAGFDELVQEICGSLLLNEPVKDATRRAVTELNKKPAAGTTIDDTQFFAAVEASTGVKPNSGETFKDYLTRALGEVGTVTNTEHLDRISALVNFPRNAGESNKDFAPRLRKELTRLAAAGTSGDYTKLLDETGKAIGCLRTRGEKDEDYLNRIKSTLAVVVGNSSAYTELRTNLLAYCGKHGLTVDKDGPIQDILGVAYGHYTTSSATGGVKTKIKNLFS